MHPLPPTPHTQHTATLTTPTPAPIHLRSACPPAAA